MVSVERAHEGGQATQVLVAPRTIGGIRRALPESLRPAFDTEVRGTELRGLQSVLRFWRARAAALGDRDARRLKLLAQAREDVTWSADAD